MYVRLRGADFHKLPRKRIYGNRKITEIMDSNLSIIVKDMESRITGRLNSMKFHFFNICVDADPVALLSTSVSDGGIDKHLEDMVDVAKKDDMTFVFIPYEGTDLEMIAQALGEAHPEFITEIEECRKSADSEEMTTILTATVPYVDEQRKDVLEKAVGTYKDAFNTYVDAEVSIAKVKMAPYLLEATKEDKDTIEQLAKDRAKEYKEMSETAAGDRIQKIEDAYKRYLEIKAGLDKEQDELFSAENPEAARTMNM